MCATNGSRQSVTRTIIKGFKCQTEFVKSVSKRYGFLRKKCSAETFDRFQRYSKLTLIIGDLNCGKQLCFQHKKSLRFLPSVGSFTSFFSCRNKFHMSDLIFYFPYSILFRNFSLEMFEPNANTISLMV